MRRYPECLRPNPAGTLLAILLLALSVAAMPARAQTSPPADPNAHLSGLSADELRQVVAALETELRFTEDSARCFADFLSARQRAADKGGQNLTAEERSAAAARISPQAWVDDCLRRKGWTNFGEAGSTDRYGRVELQTPPTARRQRQASRAETAHRLEQMRLVQRHEAEHAARRAAFARRLGLDPDTLLAYGGAKTKLDDLVEGWQTLMTVEDFGHALEDFDDFSFRRGQLAGEARALLPQLRQSLNQAEQDLIKWGYRNRSALEQIDQQAVDIVDTAREERDDYGHDATYLRERIRAINRLIEEAPASENRTQPETDGRKGPGKTAPKSTPEKPKSAEPQRPGEKRVGSAADKPSGELPYWAVKSFEESTTMAGPD